MKQSTLYSWLSLSFCLLLLGCGSSKMFTLLHQGSRDSGPFNDHIAFERVLDLIVVEAVVGGKKRRFLVDSGSPNVIDAALAEELGLQTVLKRKVSDSNGKTTKLPIVTVDQITLGATTYYETAAVVADLRNTSLLSCLDVDGFIGANLMRLGVWQIDYQKQEIQIVPDRDSLDHPPSTPGIPFLTSTQGTPRIQIQFSDAPTQTVILDLGATGGLDLPIDAYYKWPSRSQAAVVKGYGVSNTGLYGASIDTLRRLWSADFQLESDSVDYGPVFVEYNSANSPSLGNEFFENFRLTLDWKRMEAHFESQVAPTTDYPSFGFIPAFQNGQLQVGFLWENSPAAKAGLAVGDRILFMNGIDCINMTNSSFCRLINSRSLQDKWTNIDLILQKGQSTQKIQLEKRNLLP